METIITGLFINRGDAEGAINSLMDVGVNRDDISYVHLGDDEEIVEELDVGKEVGAGAASGATTGAMVGALAGLVVAAGILPGLGSVFVAGPLATGLGLTGAAATTISGAVTGAVAGGLIGALTGLGVAREDAETYEERIRQGEILVVARIDSDTEPNPIKNIFKGHNADEVRSYNP